MKSHLFTVSPSYFPGKVKGLYDAQAPMCPVCQAILLPGELQEHMEQELTKLTQLQIRYLVTNDHCLFSLHSHYNSVNLLYLPLSLFNIMPPSGFIFENHVFKSPFELFSFFQLFTSFHLSICHFLPVLRHRLSILFSFQGIINVERFSS